jgi:hypothetical protein
MNIDNVFLSRSEANQPIAGDYRDNGPRGATESVDPRVGLYNIPPARRPAVNYTGPPESVGRRRS